MDWGSLRLQGAEEKRTTIKHLRVILLELLKSLGQNVINSYIPDVLNQNYDFKSNGSEEESYEILDVNDIGGDGMLY